MNVLLLNLTRFGDLLQSQAAITDLTRQGRRVAILCLENFAEAAALLSGVARVYTLPGSAFLAALTGSRSSGGKGWQSALARLALLREKIESEFSPDMIGNLTPTLSGRMLARYLAGARPCAGFIVDEHGFGVNSNAWAAFWQGASVARGVSPFNVVDMFRKITDRGTIRGEENGLRGATRERTRDHPAADSLPGARDGHVEGHPGDASLRPPAEEARKRMLERLRALAPEGCKGYVALQPGASEDRRRWPVEYFAALGEILWREERLCPLLLGSGGEKELSARYAKIADHPFIDLCGQTGLADLAAALCACRLLVTNDTGTMHYAAGLSVPVLAVFLATAQPVDTGPYREGSCSVEPDLPCHPCAFNTPCSRKIPRPTDSIPDASFEKNLPSPDSHRPLPAPEAFSHVEACRFAISPQCMADLALSRLRHGQWRRAGDEGRLPARVWLSEYDKEGFMSLRSLSGHETRMRTLWFSLQRHYIRQFLNRDREESFVPRRLPGPVRLPPEEGGRLAAGIREAAALVKLMLQQGKVLRLRPLPMMRDRFLSTWQKVHDCLRSSPWLGAVSLLWLQETQAEGQDFPEVLNIAGQFQQLLAVFNDDIFIEK